MRTTSRMITAAQRRAGEIPCRSCSATTEPEEIDAGALFDKLMVLRDQMIRKLTREEILERALRCESEAVRLRSMAQAMAEEVDSDAKVHGAI